MDPDEQPSETQPLLSPLSSLAATNSGLVRENLVTCVKCLLPKCICRLSKAAIAITLISAVFSAAYATVMYAATFVEYPFGNVLSSIIVVYSYVAFITLFSPLSGFLADVHCSRYRVILAGNWLTFCAFFVYSIGAILTLIFGISVWEKHHNGGHFSQF